MNRIKNHPLWPEAEMLLDKHAELMYASDRRELQETHPDYHGGAMHCKCALAKKYQKLKAEIFNKP